MKVGFLVLLIFLPLTSTAGVWEERNALERYVNQIELLNKTLLEDAQASADPNSRVQLDYRRLREDSQKILNQLKHHINAPLQTYDVNKVRDSMVENEHEETN